MDTATEEVDGDYVIEEKNNNEDEEDDEDEDEEDDAAAEAHTPKRQAIRRRPATRDDDDYVEQSPSAHGVRSSARLSARGDKRFYGEANNEEDDEEEDEEEGSRPKKRKRKGEEVEEVVQEEEFTGPFVDKILAHRVRKVPIKKEEVKEEEEEKEEIKDEKLEESDTKPEEEEGGGENKDQAEQRRASERQKQKRATDNKKEEEKANTEETKEDTEKMQDITEFFVKWKERSYLHCKWVTADVIEKEGNAGKQRINRYWKKKQKQQQESVPFPAFPGEEKEGDFEEAPFPPEYCEIDRIISCETFIAKAENGETKKENIANAIKEEDEEEENEPSPHISAIPNSKPPDVPMTQQQLGLAHPQGTMQQSPLGPPMSQTMQQHIMSLQQVPAQQFPQQPQKMMQPLPQTTQQPLQSQQMPIQVVPAPQQIVQPQQMMQPPQQMMQPQNVIQHQQMPQIVHAPQQYQQMPQQSALAVQQTARQNVPLASSQPFHVVQAQPLIVHSPQRQIPLQTTQQQQQLQQRITVQPQVYHQQQLQYQQQIGPGFSSQPPQQLQQTQQPGVQHPSQFSTAVPQAPYSPFAPIQRVVHQAQHIQMQHQPGQPVANLQQYQQQLQPHSLVIQHALQQSQHQEKDRSQKKKPALVPGPGEKLVTRYLVKWCDLPYVESTWELPEDLKDDEKIAQFHKFNTPPQKVNTTGVRPTVFTPLVDPTFKNGNKLRKYQVVMISLLFYSAEMQEKRRCNSHHISFQL